jgi:prepilin-type N-terminal cleavage/methylation domain-containing protein/prepilin-type processing-associated H-X9-DG protein
MKNLMLNVRRGFTMIEIITVVAIIAILMAVLTPVVSNMMGTAHRSSDANNLRQLAMAYIAYINDSSSTKTTAFTDLNSWAQALANAGNFNEPALFLVQGDPDLAGATLPTQVLSTTQYTTSGGTTVNVGDVDPTFAACNLSVAAPTTVNLNNPAASTPVVWTRGLDPSSGTWSATSPYGTKGGYVAFLDGHVTFYKQVPTATIVIPTSANTLQRGS